MKSVRIRFSNHAEQQFKERNIKKELVRKTIAKPDKVINQGGERLRFLSKLRKSDSDRVLVVVCEKQNGTLVVITAFITSKTNKYLA